MEASGSAMNRIVYRGFPAPTPLPDGRNFGIREAILIQAILRFGYCGLVIRVLTSNLPAPAATKWGSQTGLGVAAWATGFLLNLGPFFAPLCSRLWRSRSLVTRQHFDGRHRLPAGSCAAIRFMFGA